MTSGRSKEELQGVSLLGNKTAYKSDYAPEVLESFPNKHPQMITGLNLIARNSPAFVR